MSDGRKDSIFSVFDRKVKEIPVMEQTHNGLETTFPVSGTL